MKKFIIAALSIILLSSCQKSTSLEKPNPSSSAPAKNVQEVKSAPFEIDLADLENMNKEDIESMIEIHLRQEMKTQLTDPYNVVIADYAGKFMDGDSLSVIAHVNSGGFTFKNGIFERASGRMSPMEVKYTKTADKNKENIYTFKEINYPLDGADFEKSTMEMVCQNQEMFNKLKESEKNLEQAHSKMMKQLKIEADKSGLKNYQHQANEIPGFDKDVELIESSSVHIKDTVQIISKSDYDRLLKASSGDQAHFETADGVLYDKKTGIAIKDTLYADML